MVGIVIGWLRRTRRVISAAIVVALRGDITDVFWELVNGWGWEKGDSYLGIGAGAVHAVAFAAVVGAHGQWEGDLR